MKIIFVLSLYVFVAEAKAWQHNLQSPLELFMPPPNVHTLSDCMHVTSEDGDFMYKKAPRFQPRSSSGISVVEIDPASDPTVCGVYFVTDPDKVVEVTVKFLDVECEFGGLLGFVDGWELNGEYFPGVHDHQLSLEQRVHEFCNNHLTWPRKIFRQRKFISSQNAALFQYKIPIQGSFVITARFLHNPKPCHIMAEGLAPFYTLQNYGLQSNCTLSALFPAVVSIVDVNVGEKGAVNYGCDDPSVKDKVEVGGSAGLDSHHFDKSSQICGKSNLKGPEQAIFCGTTTVRLESSGKYNNKVSVAIRQADENDIDVATVVCDL